MKFQLPKLPPQLITPFLVVLITLTSVSAWYYSHSAGWTLAYNDSMSHLNLTRLIIDNQQPGLAQMGGVWLPMHRLLQLPFIWQDTLWKTGLAGSIISMISYIVSVISTFVIGKQLTHSRLGATIAALAIATNLNFLYIQTTPLTEPLFIALFLLSAVTFIRWTQSGNAFYLCALSGLTFMQVLTRYDGWFTAFAIGLIVILRERLTLKKSLTESISKGILFLTPCAVAIGSWLLWGYAIFSDPFYFAAGPFSAKSQQDLIAQSGDLVTRYNLLTSIQTYLNSAVANIGVYLITLASLGLLYYAFDRKFKQPQDKFWFILLLLSPIAFNILSLFLGFSIIITSDGIQTITDQAAGNLFNTRYGLLALPLAAISLSFLAAVNKKAFVLTAVFLVVQIIRTSYTGVVTLADGTLGKSAFKLEDSVSQVSKLIQTDQSIVISAYLNSPVMFKLLPKLATAVHEGSNGWAAVIEHPHLCTHDLYIAATNPQDQSHRTLGSEQSNCQIAYQDDNLVVYQRQNIAQQQ